MYSKEALNKAILSKKKNTIGIPNNNAIQKYFSSHQDGFTKSMKNIANAIQRHPEIIKNNSLLNFSKTLDIGEASIIRFCKYLGFKGFIDFKKFFIEDFFEVYDENDNKRKVYSIDITSHTTPTEILTRVSNLIARITLDTKQALSQRHIELTTATEKVLNAPKVFIFSGPNYQTLIEEVSQKFASQNINVTTSSFINDTVNKAFTLSKGDVAIAISNSGYDIDILKTIQALKKNKVYTIAITTDSRSEIAIHADNHFLCFGSYDDLKDSIYIRTSQMFIFEVLLAMIISFDTYRAKEQQVNSQQLLAQITNEQKDNSNIF